MSSFAKRERQLWVGRRRNLSEIFGGQYVCMNDIYPVMPDTARSSLNEMPTIARAFFLLALKREEQGDFSGALADYETAKRLSREHEKLVDHRIMAIKARTSAAT